jgi:hypothetical protein
LYGFIFSGEHQLDLGAEETAIDPSMFDDDGVSGEFATQRQSSGGERRSRPVSLGSGVILLAQQLMAGARHGAMPTLSAEELRVRAEMAFT